MIGHVPMIPSLDALEFGSSPTYQRDPRGTAPLSHVIRTRRSACGGRSLHDHGTRHPLQHHQQVRVRLLLLVGRQADSQAHWVQQRLRQLVVASAKLQPPPRRQLPL